MGGRIGASLFGRAVRLIVACVMAGGLTAACTASSPSASPTEAASPSRTSSPSATTMPSQPATPTAQGNVCFIGASWTNIEEGDIPDLIDPTLQQAIVAAGGAYLAVDGRSFTVGQGHDIDSLVAAGAKVIVTTSGTGEDFLPAVQRAIKAGIPVIALIRPVEVAGALYLAYDPVEEGRQEARALLAAKPKGNYAIVRWNYTTVPDFDMIEAGIREGLQPAVDSGAIKIVATMKWRWDGSPEQDQQLTKLLTRKSGRVDALAIDSDELAYTVAGDIGTAGLTGKVAVGSIGTGEFVGLIRDKQVVEVWGNPEQLARATAQAAMALCHDSDIGKLAGAAPLNWPGHHITALLIKPVAITMDNIGDVVNTNMYWRRMVCGDVPPPDAPAACQPWPTPAASASSQSQP